MIEGTWVTVIAVTGGLVAVLGWKVLDIGKRAMELDRRDPGSRDEAVPS